MPVIKIEYDDTKVTVEEASQLSHAMQNIVSTVTRIEDVSVYANSAMIKVKIAPIEVFVQMSAHKIIDLEQLTEEVKTQTLDWKASNNFIHLINLTIIPMHWKVEIGI